MANPCRSSTQPAVAAAARKKHFPFEVWCRAFEFLDASSLRSAQGVCRLFREAVGKIELRYVPDSQTIDCVILREPASFRLRRIQFTDLLKGMCLLSAEEIACMIEDRPNRVRALREIGEGLAKIDAESGLIKRQFEEAKSVADEIDDADIKAETLKCIAVGEAEAGLFEDAKATVVEINHTECLARALRWIAVVEAKAGLFEDAKATVVEINHAEYLARALRWIAEVEARAGLFEDAKATANRINGVAEYFKPIALKEIAIEEAKAGLFEDAKATAEGIKSKLNKDEALSKIALAEAQAGRFEDAKATVNRVEMCLASKFQALVGVVRAEAQAGLFEIAEGTAIGIGDGSFYARTSALKEIATQLAKFQERSDEAIRLFRDAKTAANRIEDVVIKARAQQEIAVEEAKAGLFADAKATANTIGNAQFKFIALKEIAVEEAKARLFVDAKATADGIEDATKRAIALKEIAVEEAKVGLFVDAKATANRIEEISWKDQALRGIALAEAEAGLVGEAKATIDTISSVLEKIRALFSLVSTNSIVPTKSTMGQAITTARVGQVVRIRMNDFSVVPPRGKGPTLSPHAHFLFDFADLHRQL